MNTVTSPESGIVEMNDAEIDNVAGGIAPLAIAAGIVIAHYGLVALYFWINS